jgi:hypothetical protein
MEVLRVSKRKSIYHSMTHSRTSVQQSFGEPVRADPSPLMREVRDGDEARHGVRVLCLPPPPSQPFPAREEGAILDRCSRSPKSMDQAILLTDLRNFNGVATAEIFNYTGSRIHSPPEPPQ